VGEEPEGGPSWEDKGDRVMAAIDFTPWLDGPCPSGSPVDIGAKFTPSSRSGEPGEAVKFKDISTPPPGCVIDRWEWDFDGDGEVDSTEQNPSFVFNREGTFRVTLTVYADCGDGFEDSYTLIVTIAKADDRDREDPAKMGVSYLNIDPVQVLPNQEVVVSANVCNQGEERGTLTATLMVNGNAEQSQSVAVSGGSCQQVTFRTSQPIPGTYQVAINGMTGQFSVLAPRTVTNTVPSQAESGLGTWGIIAIVAVAIVLIVALVIIFRKE